MPTERNRHGLTRYIPSHIAREVRKRCGFGCLFCRCAIVEYDHFDPEYKDAKRHEADGIVALCGTHHTVRGNGQISTQQVRERLDRLREQPLFSRYQFEVQKYPEVEIGRTRIIGVRRILEVDGEELLSFDPPETVGAPPLLNARFYNRKGILAAEIVRNEWRAHVNNWDVVVSGDAYTVRSNPRKIVLELCLRNGKVTIKQMSLKRNDASIKVDKSGVVTVYTRGSDGAKLIIPNIQNETKEWLHWIKVAHREITWCTESIHELLSGVPPEDQPLKIADTLKFGSSKSVMAIPRIVQPTGDVETPWANDDRHGEFQKITLKKIGLCPHSHSGDSTMYQMETNDSDGHISSPYVGNLQWAKLAREAMALINANSTDHVRVCNLFDAALDAINEDAGKIHQWSWLMAMKIQAYAISGNRDIAAAAYDELARVAPECVQNRFQSLEPRVFGNARGT